MVKKRNNLRGRKMKQIVIRLDVPDDFTDVEVSKRIALLCDRK